MNEGTKSVNVRDYYNNGYKEGFQKGKLERERDFINILNDMDIELLFTEIKDKQGKKFELSDEFMELYNIFWDYVKDRLIKQLQKEISVPEKQVQIEEEKQNE